MLSISLKSQAFNSAAGMSDIHHETRFSDRSVIVGDSSLKDASLLHSNL